MIWEKYGCKIRNEYAEGQTKRYTLDKTGQRRERVKKNKGERGQ